MTENMPKFFTHIYAKKYHPAKNSYNIPRTLSNIHEGKV